jgi:hypothetical protein
MWACTEWPHEPPQEKSFTARQRPRCRKPIFRLSAQPSQNQKTPTKHRSTKDVPHQAIAIASQFWTHAITSLFSHRFIAASGQRR